jgi:hypothetical protein
MTAVKIRDRIPLVDTELETKYRILSRLKKYRGITYLVLNESDPPDAIGIPPELEAYGRGGWLDGKLWLDGGPQGSWCGHPPRLKSGFYWGADYDKFWRDHSGRIHKGVMWVRGRAGTDAAVISSHIIEILEAVFRRLPANPEIKLGK